MLIAITLLALALRLSGITWGLPGAGHLWPYHVDEVTLFLGLARFPPTFHPYDVGGGGTFFFLYGAHTALGWLLGLFPLGGIELFRHAPEALGNLYLWNRLLTVLLSTATVPALYTMSQRLRLSTSSSLAAALFLAVMPFPVLHAKFTIYHSLTALLALLSFIAISSGFPLVAGMLTMAATGSELTMGALWVAWMIFAMRQNRVFLSRFIIGSLIALPLHFSILVDPVGWYQAFQQQSHFIQPGSLGLARILMMGGTACSFSLLLTGLLGLAWLPKTSERKTLILTLGFLTLALLSLGNPFVRRYAALYPFIALGGGAIIGLFRRRKWWGIILLLFIILEPAMRTYSILSALKHADTRTLANKWVMEHIPEGSTVALQNWFFVPHLPVTRFHIMTFYSPDELLAHLPPYIIASERNDPSRNWLQAHNYELMHVVDRPHHVMGFVFNDSQWPEDLRYVNPRIEIYRLPERQGLAPGFK